jgi:AmmeMemoRadiSam system protein A/AmmeMemoRadiSam system protein B
VVALGFPHRGGLRGAATTDAGAIETPLGVVELDREFLARLALPAVSEARLCDHSIEIQLPFLQRAARGARVAPIYVGEMDAAQQAAVAEKLANAWTPGTVFLASSDFTHYGRAFRYLPFPTDGETASRLRELDERCVEAASSLDAELLGAELSSTGATVCGAAPIGLMLDTLARVSPRVIQVELDYQTSGEITGEWEHSVSYAALGYFPPKSFTLDETDRAALVEAAEASLQRLRETGERSPAPARGGSAALESRRGAFVSLHQNGRLLGCLGNITSREPLAEAVPELAMAAALDDPRFRPGAALKGEVDLEVSVLTPMRRIRREEQFEIGRHGAHLRLGERAGLLLPQVARDREWTARQFLEATAQKAGLKAREWCNPKARLSVFEAQVFSRRDLRGRS